MTPHSSTLGLENPMDGGAWWAAVHGVDKSWTWLSDFTFPFHFDALEKEMATHSSVPAWRIPGTGEPGGLPSIGLQRDWSDLHARMQFLYKDEYSDGTNSVYKAMYETLWCFQRATFRLTAELVGHLQELINVISNYR